MTLAEFGARHDEPMEVWCEPCQGTGEVECYCGGDLCVCGEQTTECSDCNGLGYQLTLP